MSFSLFFFILTHVSELLHHSLIRVWCRRHKGPTKSHCKTPSQHGKGHNDKIKSEDLTSWLDGKHVFLLLNGKFICFLIDFFNTQKKRLMFSLIKPHFTKRFGTRILYTKKIIKHWDTYRFESVSRSMFWSMSGTWKQNNLGGEPEKGSDQPTPREPWLDTI